MIKRILGLILATTLLPAAGFACDRTTRLYNTQTTVDFCLHVTDATVGAVKVESAAHASGDTYIMKDEGNEANTTNGFTDEGSCYSIVLTATEMQAARVVLNIEDQSTKTWADACVVIETYGNSSAQHAVPDTNVLSISGDSGAADNLEAAYDGAGYVGGTIKQAVDAVAFSGDTVAADNAELMFDGTGYAGGTIKLGTNPVQWNSTNIPAVHTAGYPIVTMKDGTGTGEIDTNAGAVVSVTTTTTATTATTCTTASTCSALGAQAKLDVNAEVVDGLNVDTYAELAACPAATASFKTMLQYLYMLGRNKFTQTATTGTLLKDDGSTGLCTFTDSDDATTFTRGEGS